MMISILKRMASGFAAAILLVCLGMAAQAVAQQSTVEQSQQPPSEVSAEASVEVSLAKPGDILVRHGLAAVAADGKLARGNGVTRTNRLGTGLYEVEFNREVANGYILATIGTPVVGYPPSGTISVSPRAGNRYAVFVKTTDVTGKLTDNPFNLVAFTPLP